MSRLLGERPVARRVPCESHVKKLVAKKTGFALGDVFGRMAFSLFLFSMPACL